MTYTLTKHVTQSNPDGVFHADASSTTHEGSADDAYRARLRRLRELAKDHHSIGIGVCRGVGDTKVLRTVEAWEGRSLITEVEIAFTVSTVLEYREVP